MGSSAIIIQEGVETVLEETVIFLGTGTAGTKGACRRLVFPTGVTPLLAPINYTISGLCWNPDTTLNLDNEVLAVPRTEVVKTLGTTRLVTFRDGVDDVIVTEIWSGGRATMTTSFLRLLLEYWLNQPAFQLSGQQYITWEPRDRTAHTYSIEIVSISVGGRGTLNIRDIRDQGGEILANAEALLNPAGVSAGFVDEEVRLEMRIVAELT
jgi:hypothetical protein